MKSTFDPAEFVKRIGQDLVRAFENAREATTTELVGDAMEQPVRDRLVQILPRGIGVGSGCVIDTKGGTSRQIDVVLYERELCPVFCINNSPETTYYPAEGVLAVGEIKSTIGKRELADSFEKICSVKTLHRAYHIIEGGTYVGRRYGEEGPTAYGFQRDQTNKGDIFGFVLAEKPGMAITLPTPSKTHKSAPKATLLGHYVDNVKKINNDVLCPDLVVFLCGTLLTPQTIGDLGLYIPTRSKSLLPHLIHPLRAESPFGELIKQVWKRYRDGLTAHMPLEHYLHYKAKKDPNLTWAAYANVPSPEEAGLKIGDQFNAVTPTDHIRNDLTLLSKQSL